MVGKPLPSRGGGSQHRSHKDEGDVVTFDDPLDQNKFTQTHDRNVYVTSNQTFASNKTFILWMLINSDKGSAVSSSWNPGTSALIREGTVGTDKC